ncbi:MAG: hypothetical protein DRH37_08915 [Deltaproteobacteria bacterium]|nr:MAG: hypothetical protein DRH37_08915 [Deltaproteobacteria bacterium]
MCRCVKDRGSSNSETTLNLLQVHMKSPILFPHTQITAACLANIRARFGELTLCQPWFMEGVLFDAESPDISNIRILRPPEDLRPEADFLRLIAEYRGWLEQNPDKGYRIFLEVAKQEPFSEETSRGIRRLLTAMAQANAQERYKPQGFEWHLILHLAAQFEKNRLEAETLLKDLALQESPLTDALENPPRQPSTPLLESGLQDGRNHLRKVLEAWFGLFGALVPKNAPLITVDPLVFSSVSDMFEAETNGPETRTEPAPSSDAPDARPPYTTRRLPCLETGDKALDDPVARGLSGRTIILMEN